MRVEWILYPAHAFALIYKWIVSDDVYDYGQDLASLGLGAIDDPEQLILPPSALQPLLRVNVQHRYPIFV